jgi:predicted metal-dependent peptidase
MNMNLGGGGTDFDCIFDYLKKNAIEPKRLIVFTDGYSAVAGVTKIIATLLGLFMVTRIHFFGTYALYDEA